MKADSMNTSPCAKFTMPMMPKTIDVADGDETVDRTEGQPLMLLGRLPLTLSAPSARAGSPAENRRIRGKASKGRPSGK